MSAAVASDEIKYFIAYYGTRTWADVVLRWNGSGTTWTLKNAITGDVLYTGPKKEFAFTGQPSTNYEFSLTSGAQTRTILTGTTAITPPVGLQPKTVSDTAAVLTWVKQTGIDSYEVANIADSYAVIAATSGNEVTVTGLQPASRQSFAVRSLRDKSVSRWSGAATFFTSTPDKVEPGAYTFSATSTFVWTVPLLSEPAWRPSTDDWFHGNGADWGDNSGVQTTYMFYGPGNPFNMLRDCVVTKCEAFVERSNAGDFGPVLSRWGLHNMPGKPTVAPEPLVAQTDAGTLARGEGLWVQLPTDWGAQLARGAFALGLAWGGVPERYQVCRNTSFGTSPRLGDVRITVG